MLDQHDFKIVRQLQLDGRISTTELAKKVGLSRPTVTNRLKRLINERQVLIVGGLNLEKFGIKIANVGLEVKTDETRKAVEEFLKSCPRVLDIFRTPEKANLQLRVWGEDDQTINSTIESIRDLPNVEIVYTRYLGTPIHGNIIINLGIAGKGETPCGRVCKNCHRFINKWCMGCPASLDYRNPLTK